MAKDHFCGNSFCLLHHVNAEPDQIEIDVQFPDGEKETFDRSGRSFENGGYTTFCKACRSAIMLIAEGAGLAAQSRDYVEPNFCYNSSCWLNSVEVPAGDNTVTITNKETGTSFDSQRAYFTFPSQHTKPLCKSCVGAITMITDRERWPQPQSSILLPESKRIVDVDNNVIH